MSGWPKSISTGAMTREAFLSWLELPEEYRLASITKWGKPRVRVPAERPVPKFER